MPLPHRRRLLLVLLLVGGAALAGLGLWEAANVTREKSAAVAAWQARLDAIADDRERAVESWLDERIADLALAASYPSVKSLLSGEGQVDPRLREILQPTVAAASYSTLALVDRDGRALLVLGSAPLPMRASVPEAAWTGSATGPTPRAYLVPAADSSPMLIFFAPVVSEPALATGAIQQHVGTVVATARPDAWLYPLLGREPAPTATGESLLVARENEEIVFLSPLRNSSARPFSLRRPLTTPHLAASAAVHGGSTVASGALVDYRNVAVLAATRQIEQGGWGLVVKVDRREALAAWRDSLARRIATWASLLAAAAALGWALRRSDKSRAAEEIAQRDGKYRLLMEQAGDAILFLRSADGRILEANRTAAQMYGRSVAELRELELADLQAPEQRTGAPAELAAARRDRVVQETEHRDANGRSFSVEVVLRPVEVGGETILLAIVRDTSERRAHRERIERLNRTLRTHTEINQVIVQVRDRDRLLRETCRILVGSGGLRMVWYGRVDREGHRLVPAAWAGYESGFLATAGMELDADHPGIARRAANEGRTFATTDSGLRQEPWRHAAEELGYRASAAFPVRQGADVVGVLVAYSELPDFFRPDMLASLEELAADLGFALSSLEAQRALIESEARYRLLFESSPQPMWVFDLETLGFLAVNDAAVRHYGWSREELLTMTVTDLLPPDESVASGASGASGAPRGLASRTAEGFGAERLWQHRRSDGSIIQVQITSHALEFQGHRAELVLADDVTERLSAQGELHRAHEILRGIVEQSPAPIYTLSADGIVTSWNRAAEEVFGWTAAEVIGSTLPIVDREACEEFDRLRDRVLAGEGFRDLEVIRRRKDGSPIVLDLATAPLRDADGRVRSIVAVAADITARHLAEEEVRRLAAELEARVEQRTGELAAANRELEAFTSSVSHDLRAPLRAIESSLHLLEEEHGSGLDEGGRRLLGRSRASVRRMNELITDLLALSRAGRKELVRTRVEMRPLAAAALLELLPEGGGEALDLVWGSLPPAAGDPTLLRQVWTNLLANALKFSAGRPRPRIEIGGSAGEKENRWFVRDNGVGFDPRDSGALFGVFQRLPGSEEFEGHGVGLALVQRVISRHGGRVWAESTPGEGATFYFSLPTEA